MPDFKDLSIIEISRYLQDLIDSLPQKPMQVFASRLSIFIV